MITKPVIYTEEYVKEQLSLILNTILENKEIIYLGEIFEDLPYSRQRYSEWAKKFSDINEISDTIKRIDDILESRVNVAGLKGKSNPTLTIFNLKNNYGWRDRTESDISIKELPKPILDVPKDNSNE
jgi:hypothetical protein